MTWPQCKVKDVFDVARGGSPRPIQNYLTDSANGLNWIMIGDASEGSKYIERTKNRIKPEGLNKSRMVHEGDFLLTNSMSFGRPYILRISGCIHDGWLVLSPKQRNVHPDFFYYLLGSQTLYREFSKRAAGAVVKNLNTSIVKEVQIPFPPLPEQKRIAAILDAADALRAKRRESLAQLDTLLQSTFLEMFDDPVTNPKGWKEKTIEEIVSDTKLGLVRSSTEFGWDFPIPYVRMDALTIDGKFLPEKVQSTNASEKEQENFALESGDLLFNTRNSKELVGKVCVYRGPHGWLFNNNLMRIRFQAGIEAAVIAAQFQFQRVQRELEQRKSGTTSVFAVYWKSFRTLPILVPPFDLQRRFATIVESIERQKTRLRTHLAELDNLFASLQARAFNGEL